MFKGVMSQTISEPFSDIPWRFQEIAVRNGKLSSADNYWGFRELLVDRLSYLHAVSALKMQRVFVSTQEAVSWAIGRPYLDAQYQLIPITI